MPALSREVSEPSSQRFARGRRKFEGGGPAGRAARIEDVEKQAVVARGLDDTAPDESHALGEIVVGRTLESIVSDLGAAIVDLVKKWRVKEG